MAGGRLTTHVLDTRLGEPARGLAFELFLIAGDMRRLLGKGRTDDDGRTAAPLLEGEAFQPGTYELQFHAGDYQADQDLQAEHDVHDAPA